MQFRDMGAPRSAFAEDDRGRVHFGQIMNEHETAGDGDAHALQIAAGLLRAQGRLTDDDLLRETLDKAAVRIMAIAEVEAAIKRRAVGNGLPMDLLLRDAIACGARAEGQAYAGCTIQVRSEPFVVSLQAALLCGVLVSDLVREVLSIARQTDRPLRLAIETIRSRNANVYLTIAIWGLTRLREQRALRDIARTLLSPLRAEMRHAEIPGGLLIFAALKSAA